MAQGSGDSAGGTLGGSDEQGRTRAMAGRVRAARRYLGRRWEELLSDQTSDEAIETQARAGLPKTGPNGMPLSGWPFTPARRVFRRRPRP